MGEEPDNIVLKLLREMRAEQIEQGRKIDRLENRFDRMDKRFDELRHSVLYALGLGTSAGLRADEQEAKVDEIEARLNKIEELLTKA
ncbi:hypothetical protein [Oharaeibacter diazotrophicus]|uniref:Uncharacterized protein n=1 Tax=Oharaeibacter diazotrophicus TaxID=1920512 RepID=A0A4R6RMC8_9HYPH|nr:hypothetical protein [Oharaeibacter diazotrophicus]TDP87315.1 hypothetical protein EDD54_1208 [Oharaeibacter diazotrophicus]BBE70741.1 hypothetical protein OHA_1_00305 [Pleomorphomonas sp. SM30]GLS77489.1 hypothetical protein GCM10007904_28260 [Oharaeibacter diazotrophicus]